MTRITPTPSTFSTAKANLSSDNSNLKPQTSVRNAPNKLSASDDVFQGVKEIAKGGQSHASPNIEADALDGLAKRITADTSATKDIYSDVPPELMERYENEMQEWANSDDMLWSEMPHLEKIDGNWNIIYFPMGGSAKPAA